MVRGGKMETAVMKPKIFMLRPGIDLKTTIPDVLEFVYIYSFTPFGYTFI